jgi:hypothetical protein
MGCNLTVENKIVLKVFIFKTKIPKIYCNAAQLNQNQKYCYFFEVINLDTAVLAICQKCTRWFVRNIKGYAS